MLLSVFDAFWSHDLNFLDFPRTAAEPGVSEKPCARLERLLGDLGWILKPFDRLLGSLEALLKPPGALMGASWSPLGGSWEGLGGSWHHLERPRLFQDLPRAPQDRSRPLFRTPIWAPNPHTVDGQKVPPYRAL